LMAQQMGEIRKQPAKVRQELKRIEHRVAHVELELGKPPVEERIKAIEKELRKEYPNTKFDRDLLKLVGTLPYYPVEKDKEVIQESILEGFG